MGNVRSVYSLDDSETFYIITKNNDLYAWGNNSYGQVGDDTGLNQSDPVLIMREVANIYFQYYDSYNYTNGSGYTIYALKTDKSRWAWGKYVNNSRNNTYAPLKINDYYNANQELLENHITMRNGNNETYPMIELVPEIIDVLGGKNNIISAIEVEYLVRSTGYTAKNSSKSRYYAITKNGDLYGWGYNNGILGDGTRANRDKPVYITSNVKRLTQDYFITNNNDWYYYSDYTEASYFSTGWNYMPKFGLKNCLYAYIINEIIQNGSMSNPLIWFTPDGKIVKENTVLIDDVKLPNITPPVGTPLGDVLYSDIIAYIDGYAIPTCNVNGNTMVVVEDLARYGFDVQWLGAEKTLVVNLNKNKLINPLTVEKETVKPGTFKCKYVFTDIMTYIYFLPKAGGEAIPVDSFNISGQTLINFEALKPFGKLNYDNEKRELHLIID